MPELVIEIPGASIRLESTRVVIGRDNTCDVQILESGVSRRHAELVAELEYWVVRDLGSRNGTWLRGVRITGPEVLETGTDVQIGKDGPHIRIASTTLGDRQASTPAELLRQPVVSPARPVEPPPRSPTPRPVSGRGIRRLAVAALLVVAVAGAWVVKSRDLLDGVFDRESVQDGENEAAGGGEPVAPPDPVVKRANAASDAELRRDAIPVVADARRWVAETWPAYRPLEPANLRDARLLPHPPLHPGAIVIAEDAAGARAAWVEGKLESRGRQLLLVAFDEERELRDTGSDLVAVGLHHHAMIALLTDADRRQAVGMRYRCAIFAGDDFPAILDAPPAPPRPAAGGELKLVARPDGPARISAESAVFESAMPADAPGEVPAVVWPGAMQSAAVAEIEGARVALFRRRDGHTHLCGRIRVNRDVRPIEHITERFAFRTTLDLAAGAALPALGNEKDAFSIGADR